MRRLERCREKKQPRLGYGEKVKAWVFYDIALKTSVLKGWSRGRNLDILLVIDSYSLWGERQFAVIN